MLVCVSTVEEEEEDKEDDSDVGDYNARILRLAVFALCASGVTCIFDSEPVSSCIYENV